MERPTFRCETCDRSYRDKAGLLFHFRTKHNWPINKVRGLPKTRKRDSLFPCPYEDCPYGYSSSAACHNHVLVRHRAEQSEITVARERPFECPYANCNQEYVEGSALQKHFDTVHCEERVEQSSPYEPLPEFIETYLDEPWAAL